MIILKTFLILLIVISAKEVSGRIIDPAKKGDLKADIDLNNHTFETIMKSWKHLRPEAAQWGCKELRAKRYFSDGFCTSKKPITDSVCTGFCLPKKELPWYAEYLKVWSMKKVLEYRCVNDVVKRKKIELVCKNGETRTYKIKVVRSCKCKKYTREQNKSYSNDKPDKKRRRHRHRKGRRSQHRVRDRETEEAP